MRRRDSSLLARLVILLASAHAHAHEQLVLLVAAKVRHKTFDFGAILRVQLFGFFEVTLMSNYDERWVQLY